MKPEREAGTIQFLIAPGKEIVPLPELDDVMLIEHKHGSLWAVHEAYARGYRAGAEAQRELDAKICDGWSVDAQSDCTVIAEAIRSAPIEGASHMQACQLCGGSMVEHKKRCPNHPEFIWAAPIEGESRD